MIKGLPNRINEKEILSRLNLDDLFQCINYFDKSRTNEKIDFLHRLNLYCFSIKEKLQHENPWTFEILNFVEEISKFYSLVLNERILTPWNMSECINIEDVTIISSFEHSNSINEESFPLIFDSELNPLFFMRNKMNSYEIIVWAINNRNDIDIEIDYRGERIIFRQSDL